MNLCNLLFSFNGRINRGFYFLLNIATFIGMGLVFGILSLITLGFLASSQPIFHGAPTLPGTGPLGSIRFSGTGIGFGIALVIIFLLSAWINFALMIKRLHDRNKSAWWILFFYLAPLALDAVPKLTRYAGFIPDGIVIWMLLELFFLRGTAGPNRYGPDPLGSALQASATI